jgi:hypothetical protein
MDIIFESELIEKENPIPDKIAFLLSFMELIVGGGGLTSSERTYIDRAAKKIYEDFLYNEKTPQTPETMPILHDLYNELYKYGEPAEGSPVPLKCT